MFQNETLRDTMLVRGGRGSIRLTPKQQAFVAEYLTDFNATQAAIRAGYSPRYAHTNAHKLLQNTGIAEAIRQHLAERTMAPDEALARLSDMARADLGDFLRIDQHDGRIIAIDMGEAKRRGLLHLVKRYQAPGRGQGASIELHDSKDALKTLLTVYGRLGVRVQVEDWRSELVRYLREGKLTPAEIVAELGDELAGEFFAAAGITPGETGEAAAQSQDT